MRSWCRFLNLPPDNKLLNSLAKIVYKNVYINASPEGVFEILDDLGITGMHMTQSSVMMLGSRLHLQYLTEDQKNLGSRYRWTGKMMGVNMDFKVERNE